MFVRGGRLLSELQSIGLETLPGHRNLRVFAEGLKNIEYLWLCILGADLLIHSEQEKLLESWHILDPFEVVQSFSEVQGRSPTGAGTSLQNTTGKAPGVLK